MMEGMQLGLGLVRSVGVSLSVPNGMHERHGRRDRIPSTHGSHCEL